MERNVANDRRIQWKKLGGGFLRLPTRLIKPGQVFWATPEEIPTAFKGSVVPVNDWEAKKVEPVPVEQIPAVKSEYTIVPRGEGNLWFDIVDRQGKIVNEKALRSDQADEMLKALQA